MNRFLLIFGWAATILFLLASGSLLYLAWETASPNVSGFAVLFYSVLLLLGGVAKFYDQLTRLREGELSGKRLFLGVLVAPGYLAVTLLMLLPMFVVSMGKQLSEEPWAEPMVEVSIFIALVALVASGIDDLLSLHEVGEVWWKRWVGIVQGGGKLLTGVPALLLVWNVYASLGLDESRIVAPLFIVMGIGWLGWLLAELVVRIGRLRKPTGNG